MNDIVEFVGPWDGPVVATSVHAGHGVRPDLQPEMVLDEATRLREEDPHTERIAAVVPSRMITYRSRFEVDLNRPREEAVYREPDDCWGLDVWRDAPLSDELTAESLAVYDTVYTELGKRLDRLASKGPFVLLDVDVVRPKLVADGMFLVGLDIVGDKLMEINVFSPGGLGSAQELNGVDYAPRIIEELERKVEMRQHYPEIDNRRLASG